MMSFRIPTTMVISIIIPVFNEHPSLTVLLDRVYAASTAPYTKEVIVIDDGSTDGTAGVLDGYRVLRPELRILRHPVNRGKAASITTGLQVARGDIILIQDGDLEYSPDDYARLLAPFSVPEVDAVYGSRFLGSFWPENMRVSNWLANKLFTCLLNVLNRARLTDEGTAYKVFRASTLRSIDITCSGFEFCAEVTSKLLRNKARIVEVPISYRARSRKEGKKPGIADGISILLELVRQRFRN